MLTKTTRRATHLHLVHILTNVVAVLFFEQNTISAQRLQLGLLSLLSDLDLC